MRITPSILSIPPYISTSWKNIASLHVETQDALLILVVTLVNGTRIKVPHLEGPAIETIFSAHTKHLELDQNAFPAKLPTKKPTNFPPAAGAGGVSFAVPIDGELNMENMGAVLQHNPDQADTPDLPEALLKKVTSLAKTLGIADPNLVPQPEPHCNCVHCQISRAMQAGLETEEYPVEEEEEVTAEDLKFRTWDISQTGDKLFIVQNPLDTKEHYSVYLGEPIGCTCGEKHCEHVQAVLNS